MTRKYRLEMWIVILLMTLYALPFVGAAEDFYAQRFGGSSASVQQETAPAVQPQQQRVALPEDSVENPIDRW
jgi:hypothetical protein